MNAIYYDLFLSSITYLLLIYLSARLMRTRKKNNGDDKDGGQRQPEQPPTLDLPPGISWPDDHSPSHPVKEQESVS
mgnify:CR=1 FL=1